MSDCFGVWALWQSDSAHLLAWQVSIVFGNHFRRIVGGYWFHVAYLVTLFAITSLGVRTMICYCFGAILGGARVWQVVTMFLFVDNFYLDFCL